MTATTLLPQAAKAAGISFPELLDRICRGAADERASRFERAPLKGAAALVRFALIGVVLLVVVEALGYIGGWFESNGNAVALSKAAVFAAGRVPLIGRFALAGGMPAQADKPATVRSMAPPFLPSGAQEWRTGMNDIPVFVVNSAHGFYEQLLAFKLAPASGIRGFPRMPRFHCACRGTAN